MRVKRSVFIISVVILSLAVGQPLAGGTQHKHKSKAKHPTATKAAAAHYVAIVGPSNVTITNVNGEIKADGRTLSGTELASQLNPAVRALTTLSEKLTTYRWPRKSQRDVRSLVSDLGSLMDAMSTAGTVNALNASQWLTTLGSDERATATASNLVRHDLGLPTAT